MISRTRLHRFFQNLALISLLAGGIGYFSFHAYNGNHGLEAKQRIKAEIVRLNAELTAVREEKENWTARVSLLRSESLDPDMLDERARLILNFSHKDDLYLKP